MPPPKGQVSPLKLNPCSTCGACCAYFKVSFLSCEVDDHEGGVIPVAFTEGINRTHSAMKGTRGFFKRCAALDGVIGQHVSCAIYQERPSTCRAFLATWENACCNTTCDRARSSYGLQPFGEY